MMTGLQLLKWNSLYLSTYKPTAYEEVSQSFTTGSSWLLDASRTDATACDWESEQMSVLSACSQH